MFLLETGQLTSASPATLESPSGKVQPVPSGQGEWLSHQAILYACLGSSTSVRSDEKPHLWVYRQERLRPHPRVLSTTLTATSGNGSALTPNGGSRSASRAFSVLARGSKML